MSFQLSAHACNIVWPKPIAIAPSEQVLGDWVSSLPGPTIEAQALSPTPMEGPEQGSKAPLRGAPAPLLGLEPQGSGLELTAVNSGDLPNDFNGLGAADGRMEIENGAPVGPVTGTPSSGGRSGLSAVSRETKPPTPLEQKRVPSGTKRVPAPVGLDRSPPKAGGGPVKKRVKSGAGKRKARKLKDEMKALFG